MFNWTRRLLAYWSGPGGLDALCQIKVSMRYNPRRSTMASASLSLATDLAGEPTRKLSLVKLRQIDPPAASCETRGSRAEQMKSMYACSVSGLP